jgi:predicted nucleic acid-binding protein
VYSTLTRYPGKQRLSAESAALLVQEVEHRLTLVWLDGDEYFAAINRIAGMGIVGGAVYDALIAACAAKAKADTVYTWNIAHFVLLGNEVARRVRTP